MAKPGKTMRGPAPALIGAATALLLAVTACGSSSAPSGQTSDVQTPSGMLPTSASAAAAPSPVAAAAPGPKEITTSAGTFKVSLYKLRKLTAADGLEMPAGYAQTLVILSVNLATKSDDPVQVPLDESFHLAVRKTKLDGALSYATGAAAPMDPAQCAEIPAAPDFCGPNLTNTNDPSRVITSKCNCYWTDAEGVNLTGRETVYGGKDPAYLLLDAGIVLKDAQLQLTDFAVLHIGALETGQPASLDGPMEVVTG
ncbi:hypothetical protein [Paractinoplanes globisporus]|uniref:Lipoprotein n=1 Tax=Paractinoplanes globisporus TaxID=113565 RepID=A0ABW6WN72_9ACTN|nr:hypothetical protein [Actinoplanes globisporus]